MRSAIPAHELSEAEKLPRSKRVAYHETKAAEHRENNPAASKQHESLAKYYKMSGW